MSRRDALPEKDWLAIADLGFECRALMLVRYDDDALTDGYVEFTSDNLIKLAKQAIRAARKLKKHAAAATEKQKQEVQDGV